MERIGFFQDAPNSYSMGRLLAFLGQIGGTLTIVVGVALVVAAFVGGQYETIGSLVGLVALGTGIDIGSMAAKNWSKRLEGRNVEVDQTSGG